MEEEGEKEIKNIAPENITNLDGIGTKIEDFESIKSGNQDFTILYKGNFGYAEKMKSKLNNKIYTVKKLPVKKELPKELIRETTFLLKSNNEYIVKLYGYFQGIEKIEKLKNIYKNNKDKLYQNEKEDKKMYFLIMEYVSDDSLDDYLKKCRSNNQIVPQDFIIKILKQLLSVLDYLYSNSIMHRDIKLNTILLDQNNNIKIRDFGRSALHRDNIEEKDAENNLLSNSTRVGRTDFVAPEILMGMEFDYKIDIFSLGLTMLCLVSKKHPIFLIGGKRSINMDLIDTNIYNEYLINLIKIMISENPLKRPSAREALYGLINIENYIKDPSEINEKKLNEIMLQENILFLQGIGTKPEDFESIKSKDKEYTILGHGNFGFAEKMRSKLNNKLYAIKRLPVKKDISQDFIRETNIMIQLNNKNVIKFYGYFQGYEKIEKLKYIYKTNENDKNSPYQGEKDDKKMYFLVLDFASNGSLKDYYEKYMKEKKPIEQEFIIKILFQLLSGLRYLHSVKIMHRDIKMDNILLDENNNIKISDFGISAVLDKKDSQNNINKIYSDLISEFTQVGTINFAAPEIINHKKGMKDDFDFKVDIYSLGLTMLCLVSKKFPVYIIDKKRKVNKEHIYEIYNEYLIKLIFKMINFYPKDRPTAADALKELEKINEYIKNPNNLQIKNYLDEKYQNINYNNAQNNSQINMQNNMQNASQNNMQNNSQYNTQINQHNNYPNNYQYNFTRANTYPFNSPNNNYQNNNNPNNNFYGMTNQNSTFNINNQIYNNNNNYNYNNTTHTNNGFYTTFNNYQGNQGTNNNNNYMINNMMYNQYNNNTQIMTTPIPTSIQNNLYNPNYMNTNVNLFSPNINYNNQFLNSGGFGTIIKPNNPLSMSANLTNTKNYNNTSLLCVLKVFYYCFKEKIEGIINMIGYLSENNQDKNFTKIILNVINFMKNEPKDNNDISSFNTNIQIFRQQMATIIPKFSGTEEIRPFNVYHEIYFYLCNESRKYNGYFEQSKLKEIKNIPGLESISSYIIQKLNNIAATIHSPFYDYFYFVFIETIKCPNCPLVHSFNVKEMFYLEFDASKGGNISDFIYNYFINNELIFNTCTSCRVNGPQTKTLSFLTRPKYLVIYFSGQTMYEKNLEDNIDLTEYSYPNMDNTGPKKYSLFAVIKRNNIDKKDFCAFIKEENNWYFYNAQKTEKTIADFQKIYPYIAIYKGED